MKRGKKALIQDSTWDKSTRKEEWWKCNMLVVHKGICSKDVRGKLLPRRTNQARDLVSSLDAHVTWGGLCYGVLGIKTKGEDCVNPLNPIVHF